MRDMAECSNCGRGFDLSKVRPIAYYADATVFVIPCCGTIADDRAWVNQPYRRVTAERKSRYG